MGINAVALESAATDALAKVSKPSWRSPTWWLSTATTVWGCAMTAGLIAGGSPAAMIVGATLAALSVITAHIKDGWVKTAIAAAPELWNLVKALRGQKVLAVTMPSGSLAPTQYSPSASGGVPQARDNEDPR